MPVFHVRISREVTSWDTFERLIEAGTEDEARELADLLAVEGNSSCPDDVTNEGFEAGSFCLSTCAPATAGEFDEVMTAADIRPDYDSDDVCPGCGCDMGGDHDEDCEEAEEHD